MRQAMLKLIDALSKFKVTLTIEGDRITVYSSNEEGKRCTFSCNKVFLENMTDDEIDAYFEFELKKILMGFSSQE